VGAEFEGADCTKAEGEALQAARAPEAADKLFHYRRALRLCPGQASYHVGMAEVYKSLKRDKDAQYEYNEALKLDPQNTAAKQALDNTARRY
jgi:Tfp pilus assembly protein PilF